MERLELKTITKEVADLLTTKGVKGYESEYNQEVLENLLEASFLHNGVEIEKGSSEKQNKESKRENYILIGMILFTLVSVITIVVHYFF